MNWTLIAILAVAIFLAWYMYTRSETFDSRMIAATKNLTPHTYDAPLQPVLRGSNLSGSWMLEKDPYSKEYESNYHLDWLPESLPK